MLAVAAAVPKNRCMQRRLFYASELAAGCLRGVCLRGGLGLVLGGFGEIMVGDIAAAAGGDVLVG